MRTELKFRLPLWKRLFDIVFSLCAIIVLSPVLIVVALAVKLESRGPLIYGAPRVGSGYRVFTFYKFRSMRAGSDKSLESLGATANQYASSSNPQSSSTISSSPLASDYTMLIGDTVRVSEREYLRDKHAKDEAAFVKIEGDPRVTRVGRFIRRYSLDELPQLFNILRGDMSVVGNRPLPLYEAEKLTSDEYVERFMAPSGLTGLWQVEKRGNSGSLSPSERKELDVRYAQNYNLWMDLRIIFRTLSAFKQKSDA